MRTMLLGISVLLGGLTGVAYVYRFDEWAALTILPVWCWLVPGLFLTWPAWMRSRRRRGAMLVSAGWLALVGVLADEPAGLVRQAVRDDPPPSTDRRAGELRVVTLNCGDGGLRAAREVAAYDPDIVLLQESPSREQLSALTRELFGDAGIEIYGVDASLVVRGMLVEDEASSEVGEDYAAACIELPGGRQLVVVSLRLPPADIRWDLWSSESWQSQKRIRQAQRERLSHIVHVAQRWGTTMPTIVGGDFNVPAGDAIERRLKPHWRDAFVVAGHGWGNTMLNDWPLQRIDRIWVDQRFIVRWASAKRTEQSDHRLVVADLGWRN